MKNKKSALSVLKNKLDVQWSLAVRTRDHFTCVMCGKVPESREHMQAHHWVVRKARSLATRWLLDNGACLCYSCHLCRIHGETDKEFVDEFFRRMTLKVPKETQDAMIKMSHSPVDFGIDDLTTLLKQFEELNAYRPKQIISQVSPSCSIQPSGNI